MAALAATNRTAEELQRLIAATEHIESPFMEPPEFLRGNVAWHMAIAAASHNELLRAFMHFNIRHDLQGLGHRKLFH